ncbi:hypothetical protein H8K52_10385 [Undibacterium seohonense]|jgi:hypothetical protein|uniref:Uncharacterized protein n=1 Tax=Undibacterium seohonense TaxID=1344950 RepID=A0ABR6X4A6_9BURK|nr:hypothetical protein [Undibacterium seohonense]MBC3807752.1 hypothetical protein [Undibacterium seohonense]
MSNFRSIQVRDCAGILCALYRQYDGAAHASFEGDLSEWDLAQLTACTSEETNSLLRQTLDPVMDFLVVPINSENIKALKRIFARPDVLGTNGAIIHTQVEVEGELLFMACDNFHDDCTVISNSVTEAVLKQWKERGILRDYSGVLI